MQAARHTDWIMTASGRPFWPLEPRVEDVSIEDIAHHLSNLCRFTGAVRTFYSVAQHSVLVSRCLSEQTRAAGATRRAQLLAGMYGLLHDASEAYLIDIPRPLTRAHAFGAYRTAEKTVQAVIYRAVGLDPDGEPADLKVIDRRMLRTEQRELMPPAWADEHRDDVLTYPWSIVPQTPELARRAFLHCFHGLNHAVRALGEVRL